MNILTEIYTRLRTVRGALALWASVATIVSLVLILWGGFRPQPVRITNFDEFDKAVARVTHYLETAPDELDASSVRRRVTRLSDVVTRRFGTVTPGSTPFVLREGEGIFLENREGVQKSFGISTIHLQHKYLYTGADGERRQLYVGQYVVFDIGNAECRVTLMAIDDGRKEAAFDFQCR